MYTACVRSTMLHGSETWAPNCSDLHCLRRNDRSMIRWICGVRLGDDIYTDALHQRLGVTEMISSLRCRRLRWYGHVQRASSCINTITSMAIPGNRGSGRPKKTWSECVRDDIRVCKLSNINPLDRDAWRAGVRRCQVLPTPETGTTAAP